MELCNSACLYNTLGYFQIFQCHRGWGEAKQYNLQKKMSPPPFAEEAEKWFARNPAGLQGYPILHIDITLLEATKPLQTNQSGQEGEEMSS